ncbi:MAG: glutamine--tRNA ligase/YqeY domain fusion protein [Myxococcales bacterium]|nr:glutamine--tRNA ligase/YqeY domain fusion protein [Myxococcales bacterium]
MTEPSDFIRDMIGADVAAGLHGGRVCTRFPPEPNGYLHIGHAKSIHLNFGIAKQFGGVCHLRMDDTNPTTEDPEYVAAIQRDVRWLGFEWGQNMFYASDYYERLYELAEGLIQKGRAYVCDLTEADMGEYRGKVGEPGKESPYRNRSVEENLDRFRRMRKGEFKEGSCTLRAKIDMASPNMKMRDPPLYRIKHAHHYRTGDAWCIYPLYDYAHCLSDSFEKITHSLCTMEFESARELYDWVVAATEVPHVPRQTEFARLNLSYTVMSKRRLLELVEKKLVRGWDDPRMPTIAGLRRRGVTREAIAEFCSRIGVAKNLSIVDMALLEHVIREDLNQRSPRVMAVLRPIEVLIENYPEGEVEQLDAPYWPHDVPKEGSRKVPFSRTIYVDRDDFLENPPKDFHRLSPGKRVRLRHAYVVTCKEVIKDANGDLARLVCTYDPATRGGSAPAGEKVAGTIQWVSAAHALDAEVRIYDRLCRVESPGDGGRDFLEDLNPDSLSVVQAKVEPSLASAKDGEHYQFERVGFFFVDPDTRPGAPVFNRTVALKDGWAKLVGKSEPAKADAKPKEAKAIAPKGDAKELTPAAKALAEQHALSADEARVISSEPALAALFEGALAAGSAAKPVASLLANDVVRELRARRLEKAPFDGAALGELPPLVESGTLSTKLAKEVLAEMFVRGARPTDIVKEKGLSQVSDAGAVEAAVAKVLADNPDTVARYKAGNANVVGALVGMVIKSLQGRANPKLVNEILKKQLG